jgi:Cu2+-exporting ATPase
MNAVFFDKTGTLTRGEFRVVDVTARPGLAPEDALALAAAAERDSEHTIAQGIVRSAEERRIAIPKAERFEALPGRGVRAVVAGQQLQLGGPTLLRRLNVEPEPSLRAAIDRAASRGQTAIVLIQKQQPVAVFAVADVVREESAATSLRRSLATAGLFRWVRTCPYSTRLYTAFSKSACCIMSL